MGTVIAKTAISTIDIILAILIFVGTDDKTQNQRNLRVGAVLWTVVNIAAIWL